MTSTCPQCRSPIPPEARVCPMCHALQPPPGRPRLGPGAVLELGYGRVVAEARVGEGGMGIVWRGWLFHAPGAPRAHEPPEPVALKVLRPQALVRPGLRDLFVNEGQALRRLSHPNVVRFIDLFEWSGATGQTPTPSTREAHANLVLATEYIDGNTLEEVIARHVARAQLAGAGALPGIPFRRAWYYFQQLLGALAAIHALGIVHRDIKPSNILIRRDGIVKLTDFGIARLATREGAPVLDGGFVPGTGAYMSPEQVLARPLDGRSDLYSAAIVLYEMLTGRTPFPAEQTEFIVRQQQVEKPPPPLRTFLAQAPPVLEALFARALAKDPTYRFANAIDMGEAFRAALGFPETPEWSAQAEMAREATLERAAALAATAAMPAAFPETVTDGRPEVAAEMSLPIQSESHERRLATLREFIVRGYRTMKMASM